MQRKINTLRALVFTLGVLIGMLGFSALPALVANANSLSFVPSARTSSATSSPAFMTPGTGTSTIVYDSYNLVGTNQSSSTVNTFAANSATFLVQLTGSSTNAVLNMNLEFSQDCVDYYSDDVSRTPFNATTTPQATLSNAFSYSLQFASTTTGGVAGAGNGIMYRAMTIPVPTRCVRMVLSDGTSTGVLAQNLAVWAQIVPIKENPR